MTQFTVVAGKIEDDLDSEFDSQSENIKYVEDFDTLDEALVALEHVSDYHFSRIEYGGWELSAWPRRA